MFFARDLGRREASALARELRRTSEIVESPGSLGQRVADGVDTLRARDVQASAIFVSISTRLWDDPSFEPRSDRARHSTGIFDGLDVFMFPYEGDTDIYVVDAHGIREEVDSPEGRLVRLEAHEASPEETAAHFQGSEGQSSGEVYAVIELSERYLISIDPAASVRVVEATPPDGGPGREEVSDG